MPASDDYAAEQDMANRAGFGGDPVEVVVEAQTGAEYAERITVAQLDAVRQALAHGRALSVL